MAKASELDRAEERATQEAEPSKFNLVRFIADKGVVMPEDKLEIYLDVAVAREIWQLQTEREVLVKAAAQRRDKEVAELIKQAALGRESATIADDYEEDMERINELSNAEPELPARVAEIDDLIPELREKLIDSRVLWYMRGVPPAMMKAVEKKITATIKSQDVEVQTDRRDTFRGVEMVRLATTRIEVPGQEDMNMVGTLAHGDMAEILDNLPPTELEKVMTMAQFLTYAGILVDPKVDAGFPGRRDESPGEPVDSGDDQGGTSVDD